MRLSTLPAINIPSQEFLSNGSYLRIQLFFDSPFFLIQLYFSPAFLVCRWYPELFSSLIWDVLVLLYIDSAAVHLRKSTDICR